MSSTKKQPAVRVIRTAQQTRDLVLKAAIDEFAEYGLAGARVDRIAQRAGVNKQALYYHYGDKDSLFEAALVYGYTKFELKHVDWQNDARSPTELMKDLIETIFDLVAVNRNHILLIADENKLRGKHLSPAIVDHIREATSSGMSALRTVLRRGQDCGDFSSTAEADNIYLLLVGQPIFYFNHYYTLSGIMRRDILEADYLAHLRSSLVGFVLAALRP